MLMQELWDVTLVRAQQPEAQHKEQAPAGGEGCAPEPALAQAEVVEPAPPHQPGQGEGGAAAASVAQPSGVEPPSRLEPAHKLPEPVQQPAVVEALQQHPAQGEVAGAIASVAPPSGSPGVEQLPVGPASQLEPAAPQAIQTEQQQ
jgi:hypothetical protein